MVTSSLFQIVLPPTQASERSARIAAQLVRSAITDLEQIRQLGESLAPEDPLSFDRPTASLLRGMYEAWASEAKLLLERVRQIEQITGPVAGSDSLRDAIGRTFARLSVSLDDVEESLRDISEGRTVSAEEIRRELRLRVQ